MRGIAGILYKGYGLREMRKTGKKNCRGELGISVNPDDWDFGVFNLS